MKKELLELVERANKEIEKTAKYLNDNKECFNSLNLKLYDICYYCGSEEMKKDFPLAYKQYEKQKYNDYDFFSMFCDTEYDFFKEDLMESFNIDVDEMIHYINRTSMFYLHSNNIISVDGYGEIDTDEIMRNILEEFYNCSDSWIIVDNKIDINLIKDIGEDSIEDLEYIIEDLYDAVVDYCKDIIFVYNYINDFKKNQVENFKMYLEYKEEELQYKLDENNKTIEKAELYIKELESRYHMNYADVELFAKSCVVLYINHLKKL